MGEVCYHRASCRAEEATPKGGAVDARYGAPAAVSTGPARRCAGFAAPAGDPMCSTFPHRFMTASGLCGRGDREHRQPGRMSSRSTKRRPGDDLGHRRLQSRPVTRHRPRRSRPPARGRDRPPSPPHRPATNTPAAPRWATHGQSEAENGTASLSRIDEEPHRRKSAYHETGTAPAHSEGGDDDPQAARGWLSSGRGSIPE